MSERGRARSTSSSSSSSSSSSASSSSSSSSSDSSSSPDSKATVPIYEDYMPDQTPEPIEASANNKDTSAELLSALVAAFNKHQHLPSKPLAAAEPKIDPAAVTSPPPPSSNVKTKKTKIPPLAKSGPPNNKQRKLNKKKLQSVAKQLEAATKRLTETFHDSD